MPIPVSAYEARLLRILRALVGLTPISHAMRHLLESRRRPKCLSAGALQLIRQTLASSTLMHFVDLGGWQRSTHLRGDQSVCGRVWERSAPESLGLFFSKASIELLMWITSEKATGGLPVWEPTSPLTDGDQFLLYRMAQSLAGTSIDQGWYCSRVYRENPLVALTQPDRFAIAGEVPQPEYGELIAKNDFILESMQSLLARRWFEVEATKFRYRSDNSYIHQLASVQRSVLDNLLSACRNQMRADLCAFLLQAIKLMLEGLDRGTGGSGDHGIDIRNLNTERLRIADRNQLYQSATVLLRYASELTRWQSRFQGIGYFDEGYAESQWWKSNWESASGGDLAERARTWVSQLEV